MTQPTPSPRPTLERLSYTTGLRVWVRDTVDLPEGSARLLEAANRLDIVPLVILFEFHDDEWSIALLADR